MKLTYEDKCEIYRKWKYEGYGCTTLGHIYGINENRVLYIIHLVDKHGVQILEHKYKYYSPEFKLKAVNRVLINKETLWTVSTDLGIVGDGTLLRWIKEYKQNGYSIIELKKGRKKKDERENQGRAFEGKQGTSKEESRAYCTARIHKKIRCLSFKKRQPSKKEIAQVIKELRQELKVSLNFILDEIHKDTSLPQITRSDYYYTINKSDKDLKNDDLMNEIIDIYYHHEKRYGYRRVSLELIRRGIKANEKKVRRLMRRMNLQGLKRHKRKYSSYKGEIGKVAPNIIKRNFFSDVPNKKWYTDITEFNLRGNKLYLSPILDGCAGDIVSYKLSRNPNLNQVIDMVNEAISKNDTNGLIFHSDQGWQYQHSYYQKLLKDNGIIQSMSRKGNSIDDGLMENFFGLLKTEMYYEQEYKYKDLNDLSKAIDDYIYYYNNDRIKSRLKGLTPIEYRNQALMRTV